MTVNSQQMKWRLRGRISHDLPSMLWMNAFQAGICWTSHHHPWAQKKDLGPHQPNGKQKTMIASGAKSNIACWNIRNILYLWKIFRTVDTCMALSEDFLCFPMIFWWFSHVSRNFHWLPKFTELHQGQLLTSSKRYACHLGTGWMIQKQHGNGELGSTIFSSEFKPFTTYFYGYK